MEARVWRALDRFDRPAPASRFMLDNIRNSHACPQTICMHGLLGEDPPGPVLVGTPRAGPCFADTDQTAPPSAGGQQNHVTKSCTAVISQCMLQVACIWVNSAFDGTSVTSPLRARLRRSRAPGRRAAEAPRLGRRRRSRSARRPGPRTPRAATHSGQATRVPPHGWAHRTSRAPRRD